MPKSHRIRPLAAAWICILLVPVFLGTLTDRLPATRGAAAVEPGGFVLDTTWPLPAAPALPVDLAMGPEGTLYVADGRHNSVMVFGHDGLLRAEWVFEPDDEVLVPMAVAVDTIRSTVHVLWASHKAEGDQLSFQGLRLDSRQLDGRPLRPLRALTGIGLPSDMVVATGSGELLISADNQVHRVRPDSSWRVGGFDLGGAPGESVRLAALGDGRVAVVRPLDSKVRLLTVEGIPAGVVDVKGLSPVAAAGAPDGGLAVLVAGADPNDPGGPGLMTFDAAGQLTSTSSLASLGMPALGNVSWPWSLALSQAGMALTTGSRQFQTLGYDNAFALRFTLTGSPIRSSFRPQSATHGPQPQLALDRGPGGELVVLDGRDGRLLGFAANGRSRVLGVVPEDTVDLSAGQSGQVYLTTRQGELWRLPIGDSLVPDWSVPCRCDLGGRLASNDLAVYVSQPRTGEVGVFDSADGQRLRPYSLPGSAGLWPTDVATGAGGLLYTADMISAQVQAWRRAESPDGVWQAGLLGGPRRVATGQWDGQNVVAALLADGYVELHDARSGRLLARWLPAADDIAMDPVDLALGPDGMVFIADAAARAVRVYLPGIDIDPTAEPQPSPSPTPSELACTITGDRVAGPSTVVLGASAGVTLSLSADCPNSSRVLGADLLLIIDRSSSMKGAKLETAVEAARSFVELLDLRYHRVGLVSFSGEATIDLPLGTDAGRMVDALTALRSGGETNISAAVIAARQHLQSEGRGEALPVVVLLTDGQVGTASDPRQPAREARGWGILFYTIGLGEDAARDLLLDISGDPSRTYMAPAPSELFPIYRKILRQVLTSLAGSLIISEPMVGGLDLLPGSALPDALVSDQGLQWSRTLLPRTGITLSYRVTAGRVGCRALSASSRADYTDADGIRRSYAFPIPTLCVVTATPSPTPSPTATRTATPTASPSAVPRPIFLPLLNGCRMAANPVDVVVLLDTSSSMTGDKFSDAKGAARSFVALLDLRRDQGAVIGFSGSPVLAQGLTQNVAALQAAVDALSLGSGTRIDRALQAAVSELLGPRRRSGNQGVIVLLSDGAHSGSAADLRRSAAEARSLGAIVYAIGFGPDANRTELTSIAGPERTFMAVDGLALKRIYREIASSIPCR